MKVFENRVLRRIFGLKREEVRGDWRKLHSKELHNFYQSTRYNKADKFKENEVGRACGIHERGEKSVQGYGGKT
jgi:hypothetical protein